MCTCMLGASEVTYYLLVGIFGHVQVELECYIKLFIRITYMHAKASSQKNKSVKF